MSNIKNKPIQKLNIPLWPVYDEREKKALLDVLESGVWGIGGKKVLEFAEKFAAIHDAKYGVCVVNGTAALEIALTAAGINGGDEVIVSDVADSRLKRPLQQPFGRVVVTLAT